MERLIKESIIAKENSYSPYSNFRVGAAIMLKDDKIIRGSNIENASYGLSICAERSALFEAYNHGYKKEDIRAIAISSDIDDFISPCGACRQVISELMEEDADVFLTKNENEYKEIKVKDLLPFAFKKEDLNND